MIRFNHSGENWRKGTDKNEIVTDIRDSEQTIAMVFNIYEYDEDTKHSLVSYRETEANMNLVISAPKLLRALVKCLPMITNILERNEAFEALEAAQPGITEMIMDEKSKTDLFEALARLINPEKTN